MRPAACSAFQGFEPMAHPCPPAQRRRERLREILIEVDDDWVRFSEDFPDPVKLLKVAEEMNLEGVVGKRGRPYRPGLPANG
jgi:ATP-dependent DNA ligase